MVSISSRKHRSLITFLEVVRSMSRLPSITLFLMVTQGIHNRCITLTLEPIKTNTLKPSLQFWTSYKTMIIISSLQSMVSVASSQHAQILRVCLTALLLMEISSSLRFMVPKVWLPHTTTHSRRSSFMVQPTSPVSWSKWMAMHSNRKWKWVNRIKSTPFVYSLQMAVLQTSRIRLSKLSRGRHCR